MSKKKNDEEQIVNDVLAKIEENIIKMSLADLLPNRFLPYAMDVITDRALSDCRDGLKPVHRRILYGMYELGLVPTGPYKKCARTVGDVLGKYHPHGDTSVYEALVVLAQDFSTRYPLVNGHGNFGSVDGDSAAAMRYTEAKLTPIGYQMLQDINKNTVDMKPNFDGDESEPTVLPTLLPTLLMNGTMGIAVGMASNMPPHNLKDIYQALYYIIEQTILGEEVDEDKVIDIIKAPDFPTGGSIMGTVSIKEGYKDPTKKGTGKVVIRSIYEIESDGTIIISELPYKVNKANLIEDIRKRSNKWKDTKSKEHEADFPQVKEVRDESDKDGLRIVIETKRDSNVQLLINNLIKKSNFQVNFNMNMTTLVNGIPKVMTLMELLEQFLAHAASVVVRRSEFDLAKNTKRLNLVEGILQLFQPDPVDESGDYPLVLDRVIDVIRQSEDTLNDVMVIGFNEEQAKFIIEMRLRQLSKVSQDKFVEEKDTLVAEIDKLTAIINDESCLLSTMKAEFEELDNKFSDERKTKILSAEGTLTDEDLVEDETLIITYTTDGIIKAVEEGEYKTQKRGGKGVRGANTKDEEIIKFMFTSHSKDDLLFFTNEGRCHTLKAYRIDKASKSAKGRSINNYLNLNIGEKIVSVENANLKENPNGNLLFVTKQGFIKRLALNELSTRFSYTNVIKFKNEKDTLVQALLIKDENIVIVTKHGMSIRIDSTLITSQGRGATGVKGINVAESDEVMDMCIVKDEDLILTVTENGLGKKTKASEWNLIGRGGKGVKAHLITEKTGDLISVLTAEVSDELFIATEQGQITRISTTGIRTCGRSSQGVKIINLNEDDKVASLSINKNQDEEEVIE
jgi:DNA gyrase subunit A